MSWSGRRVQMLRCSIKASVNNPSMCPSHSPNTLVWLLIALLVSSCASPLKPDLRRLYGESRQATDQPPVILIHGILGGKLRTIDSKEEVWPGPLTKLIFSDYESLALDINPATLEPRTSDLEAYHITDKAAGRDFYGAIIGTLEDAGGFSQANIGTLVPPGSRNYYLFVYDWRQDNIQTVRQLEQFIEQIRLDYSDPELKVDLIAHSMGGLIARYYMRYGSQDVLNDNDFPVNLAGAQTVRRAVILGTPNLGSVETVKRFTKGVDIVLGTLPPEALATMPSVYQLLPHALNDWLITPQGKPLKRDVFDVNTWRRFGWGVFDPQVIARIEAQHGTDYVEVLQAYFGKHLERARRFTWSLTVPLEETPVQLIVFGGDCELTPTRYVVENVGDDSILRLTPDEIANPVDGVDYSRLMMEPGDGIVSKASLLARESLNPSVPRHKYSFFPIAYPIFLCEEHDQLTGNVTFQDNLLQALLNRDQ